jgi:DNA-directed RNA polymerase subunit RPC12/RpoP
MQCPKCHSNFLMIRNNTGFERLLIFLTGLREYRCRDCDQKFRAPDRRLTSREVSGAEAIPKQFVNS